MTLGLRTTEAHVHGFGGWTRPGDYALWEASGFLPAGLFASGITNFGLPSGGLWLTSHGVKED